MSSIDIQLLGLVQVRQQILDLPKQLEKTILNELKAFGTDVVRDAKTNLKKGYPIGATDTGLLANTISYEAKGLSVEVIVASDYAAYVEFGTRKFAAKYVSTLPPDWQTFAAQFKGKGGGTMDQLLINILAWVKRKGFAAYKTKGGANSGSKNSLQAQESAAYIIALRILQNGVRAHPFLFPAVVKNKQLLIEKLNKL